MSRRLSIRRPSSVQAAPSIGMTVLNGVLVMASVRQEPLRVTGIYRHDLRCAAAATVAHDKLLGKALRHGRRALCLPRGAAVMVALQPQESRIIVNLDETPGEPVMARCRPTLPRLVHDAGFGSTNYDVLPAALARAALSTSCSSVSFHHRSGWRILATAERLEAHWSTETVGDSCTDDASILGAVHIPPTLAPILRVGLDAGAIGAALGDIGLSPKAGRMASHDVIDLRGAGSSPAAAIA